MKKDLERSQTSPIRNNERSMTRNLNSPWFEWEPTRWLDSFWDREFLPFTSDNRFLSPAIDIDETADEYTVCADLPGMKKEDISIETVGNQLTISAERKYDSADNKKSGRRERFYGTYQRSFTLPVGVDSEKVAATYENGVLTVHIPKGEQGRSRKIQIGDTQRGSAESDSKH